MATSSRMMSMAVLRWLRYLLITFIVLVLVILLPHGWSWLLGADHVRSNSRGKPHAAVGGCSRRAIAGLDSATVTDAVTDRRVVHS
jgi:hypothetical protein